MQRRLRDQLSEDGAAYTRFVFAVPFALVYAGALYQEAGGPSAHYSWKFFLYSGVGGVAQIFGTAMLLRAVTAGNFGVGTSYSKTEPVQTAFFGMVFLGEGVSVAAGIAILASLVGVLVLSNARTDPSLRSLRAGWTNPAARAGLACGASFALAAVFYRAASLSLDLPGAFLPAAITLACTLTIQTVVQGVRIAVTDPAQFGAIWSARTPGIMVGLTGMLASVGWFTAMTLENAAYVRALGQVELVFTFLVSAIAFGEKTTRVELLGVLLIVGSLLLIVLP